MKCNKAFFWKGAHSYHRCLHHLVFIPKYRRRVLKGKLPKRIRELLFECAQINKWFVHELEVMPDHVHMLLQLPPNISVSKAVMLIKGGTSKMLRKEFPEIKEFLWGDSFWQDGYFVETVGKKTEAAMRQYIQSQWEQEDTSPVL